MRSLAAWSTRACMSAGSPPKKMLQATRPAMTAGGEVPSQPRAAMLAIPPATATTTDPRGKRSTEDAGEHQADGPGSAVRRREPR